MRMLSSVIGIVPPYGLNIGTQAKLFSRAEPGREYLAVLAPEPFEQLSNRVFETYNDVLDACCAAWNALIEEKERIASIATRDWASVTT
jgi:hypothetical protein